MTNRADPLDLDADDTGAYDREALDDIASPVDRVVADLTVDPTSSEALDGLGAPRSHMPPVEPEAEYVDYGDRNPETPSTSAPPPVDLTGGSVSSEALDGLGASASPIVPPTQPAQSTALTDDTALITEPAEAYAPAEESPSAAEPAAEPDVPEAAQTADPIPEPLPEPDLPAEPADADALDALAFDSSSVDDIPDDDYDELDEIIDP